MNQDNRAAPTQFAWFVFLVGLLASMGTSCPAVGIVDRVHVHEGVVYAASEILRIRTVVSASFNKGVTWQHDIDAPEPILNKLDLAPRLPKVICDPDASDQCFRVAGQGKVESSDDGGMNWASAWEIPEGRRELMDRLSRSRRICRKRIDLGPYDIALVGAPGERVVVVALGNEGVLRRSEDGNWSRHAVGYSSPTPYTIDNSFSIPWLFFSEMAVLGIAAGISFVVLTWIYWAMVLESVKSHLPHDRSTSWILQPLRTSLRRFGVIFLVGLFLQLLLGIIFIVAEIPWRIIVARGSIGSWRRLSGSVPYPKAAKKALAASILVSLVQPVLGFAPFVLWFEGTITHYQTALILAIAVVASLLALGVSKTRAYASSTIVVPDTQ